VAHQTPLRRCFATALVASHTPDLPWKTTLSTSRPVASAATPAPAREPSDPGADNPPERAGLRNRDPRPSAANSARLRGRPPRVSAGLRPRLRQHYGGPPPVSPAVCSSFQSHQD